MTKKEKIKKLLSAISTVEDNASTTFESLDKELKAFSDKLKESINAKTVQQASAELKSLQRKIEPLKRALDELKGTISEQEIRLRDEVSAAIAEIDAVIEETKRESVQEAIGYSSEAFRSLTEELSFLQGKLESLDSIRSTDIKSLNKGLTELEDKLSKNLKKLEELENRKVKDPKDWSEEVSGLKALIDKYRSDVLNKVGSFGGGNMNRNIAIGGNTSVLSKYTDINLKPGSNVTITYSNNNTTKYVDVTIASSGGGGSVGGVVRSINTITTSQTAGETSGTDYVYVCSQGVALTLPTAAANTNLYTVKNTSNSSVLVATTGGETIDDDTEAILSIKYTSIDLVSDGTNWKIT